MELDDAIAHATALEEALTSFGRQARRLGTPGRDRGLGFPTRSQLQELNERLSRISLQFRKLHNASSSQDRVLPDDVLHLILEQACVVQAKPPSPPWEHRSIFHGSSMFSVFTARILAGVCMRWRSLLLSNPIVWSDVRIAIMRPGSLSWLDACLTRSASSSVGCMIQIDQPYGILRGPDIIARHPSNIRCLHINTRSEEDYDFITLGMKNLERLHINNYALSRRPIPIVSHLPKLRVVILQHLPTLPHGAFINLTDLTLHSIVSPITNLVDTLRANQTLERIRLIGTFVEADPHGRSVTLPNLKLLCISRSSPVAILRISSPLPTPSRVIVHDNTTGLAISEIGTLFNPFLIFGPKDPVRTASISMLPGKASFTFHTFNGATVEITIQATPLAAGGQLTELSPLLQYVSRWGPFPELRSMHLHIEHVVTGPAHSATIHSLLSRAPRVIHLSFDGPTLFHCICQVLSANAPGTICPELEHLGGTLRPKDQVVEGLHLLSEAVKRRPVTIRKITLDVPSSEEEIAGILTQAGPFTQELKSHGIHELLLTPIAARDYF